MVWRLSQAASATWASSGSPVIASLMASIVILLVCYKDIESRGERQAMAETIQLVRTSTVSPTFNQPRDVVSSSTTSSGVSFPLI